MHVTKRELVNTTCLDFQKKALTHQRLFLKSESPWTCRRNCYVIQETKGTWLRLRGRTPPGASAPTGRPGSLRVARFILPTAL